MVLCNIRSEMYIFLIIKLSMSCIMIFVVRAAVVSFCVMK